MGVADVRFDETKQFRSIPDQTGPSPDHHRTITDRTIEAGPATPAIVGTPSRGSSP
jgi:hypothetical protein